MWSIQAQGRNNYLHLTYRVWRITFRLGVRGRLRWLGLVKREKLVSSGFANLVSTVHQCRRASRTHGEYEPSLSIARSFGHVPHTLAAEAAPNSSCSEKQKALTGRTNPGKVSTRHLLWRNSNRGEAAGALPEFVTAPTRSRDRFTGREGELVHLRVAVRSSRLLRECAISLWPWHHLSFSSTPA